MRNRLRRSASPAHPAIAGRHARRRVQLSLLVARA